MKKDDPTPPITIRINLLIQERPKSSGPSSHPRAGNNHRNRASTGSPSSSSVPLTGGSPHNPLSRRSMPGFENALPENNPSPHPALEGALDRNRLKDLLAKKQAKANATTTDPDIEVTLVLYV